MKPGDLLEYRCPNVGIVWQWRIHSVVRGALRQEDLIEVSPVMAKPGTDLSHAPQETVWVPEPMTRLLKLVEVDPAQGKGDGV